MYSVLFLSHTYYVQRSDTQTKNRYFFDVRDPTPIIQDEISTPRKHDVSQLLGKDVRSTTTKDKGLEIVSNDEEVLFLILPVIIISAIFISFIILFFINCIVFGFLGLVILYSFS